jgi:hypothetical protein
MDELTLRRIELLSGLGAAVVGLLTTGYLLIVDPVTLLNRTGEASTLIVLFAALAVLAGSAFVDSQFPTLVGIEVGLSLLWASALTVWGFVLTGNFSINWYIVPAAVLALASAMAATFADLRTRAEA